MNRPEPIELENNLGPDAVTGEINRVPWMAYDVDEMDIYIAEKDAEIAELKKKLMPCLNGDCILTCEVVEKYGKENAGLKKKLEDVQAKVYADSIDAGMENRKLKRELCGRLRFRRHHARLLVRSGESLPHPHRRTGEEKMKKLVRKIIYNYVFKRLVAWFKGELVDQELTDAIYTHDIYYDIPESMSNEVKGCLKWPNLKHTK